MTKKAILDSLAYYLSPCVLAILFCLSGFIIDRLTFSGNTRDWTHLAAAIFAPAFFILGSVIVATRFLLKNKTLLIWIVELILVLLVAILFLF